MNPHREDKALQESILNSPSFHSMVDGTWKLVAICAIIIAAMGWGLVAILTVMHR